jgi:hypothetical protein
MLNCPPKRDCLINVFGRERVSGCRGAVDIDASRGDRRRKLMHLTAMGVNNQA